MYKIDFGVIGFGTMYKIDFGVIGFGLVRRYCMQHMMDNLFS